MAKLSILMNIARGNHLYSGVSVGYKTSMGKFKGDAVYWFWRGDTGIRLKDFW